MFYLTQACYTRLQSITCRTPPCLAPCLLFSPPWLQITARGHGPPSWALRLTPVWLTLGGRAEGRRWGPRLQHLGVSEPAPLSLAVPCRPAALLAV